jgi:transposase
MIRLKLTKRQVLELQRVFDQTSDLKLRMRTQIILMFNRGRSRQQIMADAGVCDRTITRWLNIYIDRGLEGLIPKKAPGRPPAIPESMAPQIVELVIQGPVAQGLSLANWTYEELAAYLRRSMAIHVKKSAMAEFCQKHDIRPYRPTYRFLRGDPLKQAKAAVELASLKKSRKKQAHPSEPGRGAVCNGANTGHGAGG